MQMFQEGITFKKTHTHIFLQILIFLIRKLESIPDKVTEHCQKQQ